MGKRLRDKRCYFCGAPATSREHAPPRALFSYPGCACDSITVPACDQHNSAKSGMDQAIVSAFLIPLQNTQSRFPLDPEVARALRKGQRSFDSTKWRAYSQQLISDGPTEFEPIPEMGYLHGPIRPWMRQLTAALSYYDQSEPMLDWDHADVWSPMYIVSPPTPWPFEQVRSQLVDSVDRWELLKMLSWSDGWSAHPRPYPPNIYRFRIVVGNALSIFEHTFYDQFRWYVSFEPTDGLRTDLERKIQEGH